MEKISVNGNKQRHRDTISSKFFGRTGAMNHQQTLEILHHLFFPSPILVAIFDLIKRLFLTIDTARFKQ